VLGAALSLGPGKHAPAGTGYTALELCTRSLHSGEDFERVQTRFIAPKVSPLPHVWAIRHDAARVTVETTLPALGHARVAVFREGLGCTSAPPE